VLAFCSSYFLNGTSLTREAVLTLCSQQTNHGRGSHTHNADGERAWSCDISRKAKRSLLGTLALSSADPFCRSRSTIYHMEDATPGELRTASTNIRATLTEDEFRTLCRRFAAASAERSPSWAWVEEESSSPGPFCLQRAGYLRSSPILLHEDPGQAASKTGEPSADLTCARAECEVDAAALCMDVAVVRSGRLNLDIVYSQVYHVPVLLLQGHHPDGAVWTPTMLRKYLATSSGEGLVPLAAAVVSQLEHPVLRVPFCCLDPCETAALMGQLLRPGARPPSSPGSTVDSTAEQADGNAPQQLDYLSSWWSIIAPLVGVASRSCWFAG
jgi:hypothetical protein